MGRMESTWVPRNLASVSREAVLFLRRRTSPDYTPEDAEREQLQLQLLSTVLQIYSNHPRNYSILEPKFFVSLPPHHHPPSPQRPPPSLPSDPPLPACLPVLRARC